MFRALINKTRNILPFVAIGLSIDSFLMNKETYKNRIYLIFSETERLTNELNTKQDIIIANVSQKTKIASLTADATDQLNTVNHYSKIIKEFIKKLDDPNTGTQEREFLLNEFKRNKDFEINSLEKANSTLQKIIDIINSDNTGNDFLNQINVLIENYRAFLSTLTLDQIVIILNMWVCVIIFNSIFSIAAVLYGDFLIRYFKLETKFPRIAAFIQLRRKFQ